VTMPVKYVAPILTVVKIMNNLNVSYAHSYLYPGTGLTEKR